MLFLLADPVRYVQCALCTSPSHARPQGTASQGTVPCLATLRGMFSPICQIPARASAVLWFPLFEAHKKYLQFFGFHCFAGSLTKGRRSMDPSDNTRTQSSRSCCSASGQYQQGSLSIPHPNVICRGALSVYLLVYQCAFCFGYG